MNVDSSSFQYLTKEVVEQFDGPGSESLAQLLQVPNEDEKESHTSVIFTELLMRYKEGVISIESILKFLALIIKDELTAEIFCQVLNIFPNTTEYQKLLVGLYQNQNVIKLSTISKCISLEFIQALGIVPADVLTKQLNVHKRDAFYTQKKYNLIHEEIEGFSKLIVELYDLMRDGDSAYRVDYAQKVIESLIGHYSLDPNRCLDIIFEVYSNTFVGNQDFAITLLKKMRWWPEIESDCLTSFENLSIGGNETASKLIGLRLLKHPRDKDVPETLKILFACLIKEGFVSFGSVYKYMGPNDEEMKTLEELFKKELNERVFRASASALALAAPLQDDEDSNEGSNTRENRSSTKSAQADDKQSIQSSLNGNMKYQFLKVCLANGLYLPSLYILTEYPFLSHIDSEVIDLMNRLFDAMIAPLYNSIKPFTDKELEVFQESKRIAFSRPFNNLHYETYPCSELLSFKPTIKSYSQKKFIYFYSNWNKKIPKANSVEELFDLSKQFLKFIGPNLASDTQLLAKICDIATTDLEANSHLDSRLDEWFTYFRNFIFPALPLIDANPIVMDKAFSVLEYFLTEQRYNLYSELHQVLSKNNPHIKISYGKAEKATKDVLKRLSKENVRPMMRKLAKITYSNPLPCFLTVLQQIESYDNLNSLVVETARYFNGYGWDVLPLALLMRLTAAGRSNVQADGLNDRQWIQSLASFIGKICLRYPDKINLKTLLSYIIKSLHSKDTSALIVLRELLAEMGGLQTFTNLTLRQVNMINSRSSLEKIVYRIIDDQRYQKTRSGEALVKALVDLDAANELFILLCQLKNDLLREEEKEGHLKVLASKIDDLNNVIHLYTQLVTFFDYQNEVEQKLLPRIDFIRKYKISPEWAFEIWRPSIKMTEATTSDYNDEASYLSSFKEIFSHMSTSLYVTFWQLSLHDINYSKELYDTELEKLKASCTSLNDTISITRKSNEASKLTMTRLKDELHQNEEFIRNIPEDAKRHEDHNIAIFNKFKNFHEAWFLTSPEMSLEGHENFLQYCILPRAVHSSFDAVFSAKFLVFLHNLNVENFSFLALIDILINGNILFGTLFTSTFTEAENLGLFFCEILKILDKWRDESIFNSELLENKNISSLAENGFTFSNYKQKVYDYHCVLFSNLKDGLLLDNYMTRRNTITFLKTLVGTYPIIQEHSEDIIDFIDDIALSESREDLKLSSNALKGHIKSKSNDWIPLWNFLDMNEDAKSLYLAKIEAKKEIRRKKEQEAREKIQREKLREKLKKEKSMLEEKKRAVTSFSYEETSTPSSRPNSRNLESTQSRRSFYSKYEDKVLKTPSKEEPSKAENDDNDVEAKSEVSTKDEKSSTPLGEGNEQAATLPDLITNSKSPENEKEKEKDVKEKNESIAAKVDLKARIREAKRELKESSNIKSGLNVSTPLSKPSDSENGGENGDESDSKTSIGGLKDKQSLDSGSTREVGEPKARRAPLPPQDVMAKRDILRDSKYKNERDYSTNQGFSRAPQKTQLAAQNKPVNKQPHHQPLPPPSSSRTQPARAIPPPPPPPPPPVNSSANAKPHSGRYQRNEGYGGKWNGGRYDKRKYDGYNANTRGYDKRQRH